MIYMYVSLHVRFVTDCLRKYIVLIRLAIYEIDQPTIFRYIISDKPNKCFIFSRTTFWYIYQKLWSKYWMKSRIGHTCQIWIFISTRENEYIYIYIYWLIGHQVMSLTCRGSRRHNRDRSNLGCIDRHHALCTWLHSCKD